MSVQSWRYKLNIALQVCQALQLLHARHLVHRDIKPSNILMAGADRAILIDFGIALDLSEHEQQPKGNVLLGSLAYVSPEQAQGLAVDTRTDLYSLGVTLFELFTGQRPFRNDSMTELLLAHVRQKVPNPQDLVPALPLDICRLILALMSKSADKRPPRIEGVIHYIQKTIKAL